MAFRDRSLQECLGITGAGSGNGTCGLIISDIAGCGSNLEFIGIVVGFHIVNGIDKLTGVNRVEADLILGVNCKAAPQFLRQRQAPCQSGGFLIVAKVHLQHIIVQHQLIVKLVAAVGQGLIVEEIGRTVGKYIYIIRCIIGICPVPCILTGKTVLVDTEPLCLSAFVLYTKGEEQVLVLTLGDSTGNLPVTGISFLIGSLQERLRIADTGSSNGACVFVISNGTGSRIHIDYIFQDDGCLVVTIHCLNKCLQLFAGGCLVVHSCDVVHGAVANSYAIGAVGCYDFNHFIVILRIDAGNLYIMQSVFGFCIVRSLSNLKGNTLFAAAEVEADSYLTGINQRCTIEADSAYRAVHADFKFFRRLCSICNFVAGVCRIGIVILKVLLCSCTVVQHSLYHCLCFGIIAACQNFLGIAADGIGLGNNFCFTVHQRQGDIVCHLRSCQCNCKHIVAILIGGHLTNGIFLGFVIANSNLHYRSLGDGRIHGYMVIHIQIIA